ncbi:MAG: pitrilysin family protein [bacterium]
MKTCRVIYSVLIVLIVFFLPSILLSYSPLDNSETFCLDNGLKVILKEDHEMPLVSFQVWVKAGSIDENAEINGISHFMEHMMFKGTENFSTGEISRNVESWGGVINAATSDEYTFYYISIPSEAQNTALEILYEISSKSIFSEEELERERLVIIEEISRKEDNPNSAVWDVFRPLVYKNTPYKYSIIGSSDVINKISREDMVNYYREFYIPENISFIGVGDLKTKELLKTLNNTFGQIEAKNPSGRPSLIEPDHLGEIKHKTKSVNQTYFLGGFLGPTLQSQDQYALDILSIILGQGRSSRLYQHIYENKQLVWSISSSFYTNVGSGLFIVSANIKENKTDDFIKELKLQIQELKNIPPAKKEVMRAKKLLKTQFILGNETYNSQANTIGYYALYEQEEFLRKYEKNIMRVTPADVVKAANKYLQIENINIAVLEPEK